MKIAVGQLCSSSNLARNLETVLKIFNEAAQSKSRILFLPEATDYIARNADHSRQLASDVQSQFLTPLLNHIKQLKSSTYVSLGVHLPGNTSARVKNVHLLIDPEGTIVQQYQKIHLFDVDVPNGPILKESNSVEPGSKILDPFPINDGGKDSFHLGLAICYDIRFPELSLKLREKGANILTFPSAFTTKTGDAHWEILTKARALDSQCFVINAAQCGKHDTGTVDGQKSAVVRESYGESIVVDAWGKVLARASKYSDEPVQEYEVIYAELNLSELEKTRQNMPLLDHRRSDVYK